MKDRAKLIDTAKNYIIAYLLLSAVFLMFKAVVYEPDITLRSLISRFGSASENAEVSAGSVKKPVRTSSSIPMFILVTDEHSTRHTVKYDDNEDISHYAVKYDNDEKNRMFSLFSSALGEALGSSKDPEPISADEWKQALGGSGVFFDYLYPQPLSTIAVGLGTEITENLSSDIARRLFLGNVDGNLLLYYISEDSGTIYRCETASGFASLLSKIKEFPMGNAKFAFELHDEYENLDPYFIFSGESTKIREVSAANPLRNGLPDEEALTELLNLFEINSRIASQHPEGTDGSVVYVENGRSLRIDMAGKMLFSVTGKNGIVIPKSSDNLTITDCISMCSQIVENSIGQVSGEGEIGLTSIKNLSFPSSCSISFGYFIGGIPVTFPNGVYAANFQINGGAITRAEFRLREYTYSGDTTSAIPEKMAVAIVKSKGGEPILTYGDQNDGVTCTWIIN
ncbi:MAG: hypothetical protein GXY01_08045 [Clostridiales bacterium]|jgi:hypothetical protein|nr:hypothetical protein [Clostridiales bacterium]